ncbi:hypothetical protein Ahy_A08g038627 [Arachis hypogaea]|uniref:RNase H type-1 domain-containing protein n=1 Tax=Arachis hypogaea TaxID=3818 RepID=A0A445BTY6_ARAHY|nr:hypothetical protein Ahy_A08g038627 [Arachis hypogaea]
MKYENQSTSEDKREIWKEVWRIEVPQKIRKFLWKACHDILLVGSNLHKRKMSSDPICQICLKSLKTVEHALLLCDWARATWFGAECQWTPTVETVSSIGNWIVECIRKVRAGGGEDQEKRISKKDTGTGAIAVVIRDSKGRIILGFSEKIQAKSSIVVEAQAIRQALIIVNNLQMGKTLIESDNLKLVQAIKSKTTLAEAMTIIQNIQILMKNVPEKGMT